MVLETDVTQSNRDFAPGETNAFNEIVVRLREAVTTVLANIESSFGLVKSLKDLNGTNHTGVSCNRRNISSKLWRKEKLIIRELLVFKCA